MSIFFGSCVFASEGYKDLKFGMSINDVRTKGFCDQWRLTKYNWIYKGKKCYKVAGKKRDFFFFFSKHRYKNFVAKKEMDAYSHSSRLEIIMIDFGMYDNSLFNVLKKSLKKKYKLEYELSDAAMIRNNLAKMIFYDEGRVSLIEDNIDGKMYLQYSDDPSKEYIKFLPNKLNKVDSSEL